MNQANTTEVQVKLLQLIGAVIVVAAVVAVVDEVEVKVQKKGFAGRIRQLICTRSMGRCCRRKITFDRMQI